MSNLKVIDLSTESDEWDKIFEKHVNGEIQPRYDYISECTEENFQHHKVIRGLKPDNTFTESGFLRLPLDAGETTTDPGDIIAGVNQIPRGAEKHEF